MTDKQLSTVNAEKAREKAHRGEAINLKELAVAIDMSYGTVRSWNLPLLNGKLFKWAIFGLNEREA